MTDLTDPLPAITARAKSVAEISGLSRATRLGLVLEQIIAARRLPVSYKAILKALQDGGIVYPNEATLRNEYWRAQKNRESKARKAAMTMEEDHVPPAQAPQSSTDPASYQARLKKAQKLANKDYSAHAKPTTRREKS